MKQQYQVREVENGWIVTDEIPGQCLKGRLWIARNIDACRDILMAQDMYAKNFHAQGTDDEGPCLEDDRIISR